jgi:hypothetical protein
VNRKPGIKFLAAGLTLATAMQPGPVLACAACYGASDSPLAAGMNWGIFSLLAVVVAVLGSIAAFFVFLARKAAAVSAASAPGPKLEPAPSTATTQ